MINGYNQLGLDVDLSSGTIRNFQISDEIIEQCIGGRGLGAYYLTKIFNPAVDPFSEKNMLVFATGGLAGSLSPASGRFSVSFKSPLTNTISCADSGGFWGNVFMRSGFDVLIIRGQSKSAVYLSIHDGQAELLPCPALWGRTVPEATTELLRLHGNHSRVCAIGPAGENRVRFASIMNDFHRAVGRGGAGAVMGAKKLKAIVVNGRKQFQPHDAEKFQTALYQANKLVRNMPVTSRALTELGTPGLVKLIYHHDMLPSRNFQSVFHQAEDIEKICGETLRLKLLKTAKGCFNCTIRCGRATAVNERHGEGPEYETIAIMGANLGIYDLEAIALASYVCNETGMDTISFGGTVAAAMEMNELGIIPQADLKGLDLRFNAAVILEEIARKTAYREGFGDMLAEGAWRLAAQYGRTDLAMTVKGMELPGYDPRASLLQALGYATSPRGGCHLKGGYAVCLGFFGGSREVNRFLTDTSAGHSVDAQNSGCVSDMLGVCRFVSYSVNENELSRLYSAYTGRNLGPDELKDAAAYIQNLERKFNISAGFTKIDDTLPNRFFTEKLKISGKLRCIDKSAQFEPMLKKYYEIREWDDQGIPFL